MFQDLRFTIRMFRRDAGFTALAVVTLMLGIGATTLVFSLADSLVFHAFPYRDAGRITLSYIHELRPGGYSGSTDFTVAMFRDYERSSRAMEEILGYRNTSLAYRTPAGVEQVEGAWVTPNLLHFLGVDPLLGRGAVGEGECLISYRFWQEHLRGQADAAGSTIMVNERARVVTGVMPPRFQFLGAAVWLPLGSGSVSGQPRYLQAMGRLRPDVTLQAAAKEFDSIEQQLADAYPQQYPDKRFRVSLKTLPEATVGHFRSVLYTAFAAVGLLLLIACGNGANLLLARGTKREREMAIRSAVGASRGRLACQLLAESGVLAATAGAFGCLVAMAGVRAIGRFVPASAVPGEAVIALQPRALWFACGVTAAVTLLCGLAPALRVASPRPDKRHGRLRSWLVVAEVALCFLLLSGAGLMTRTFFALTHVNLGFDASHLLHARMTLPRGQYETPAEQKTFIRSAVNAVEKLPGVVSATFSLEDTAITGGPDVDFDVTGETRPGNAALAVCDETYFQTMGRTLLRGRAFSADDIDHARHGAIVNQTFARAYFAGRDPLGRKLHFHVERWLEAPKDPDFEITGVVSDSKNHGLREGVQPQIYVSYTAFPVPPVGIMVRTRVAPLSLVESVRRQVWAVDPNVALTQTGTVEGSIGETYYAEPRFGLLAVGVFAAAGLALVLAGIFSVMAYTVSARTHEIGIRMALGARPGDVLGSVLGQGAVLIAAGVALGLGTSLGLTRLMASQLWGVAPNDPATLLAAGILVPAAGVLACIGPALRAARIDPVRALAE